MEQTNKLEILQAMRGIAALSVVIFHIIRYFSLSSPWLSSGVDLFFMISGFIMVYTTANNDGSFHYFLKFLIKRFVRIFPVYLILTLLYLAAKELTRSINPMTASDYTSAEVIKSIFFIPMNLSEKIGPFWGGSVLHTGWSLNYEVYFYMLFAATLFFKKLRYPLFFGLIFLSVILLPLANGHIGFDGRTVYEWSWGYLHLMTSPLILEFAIGVIIGLLYSSNFIIKSKQACWLMCLLSVSFASWLFIGDINGGYGIGISNFGFPLILVFLSFIIASKTITFKIPHSMVWLGNISFSLYLVHPIVIDLLWEVLWTQESLHNSMVKTPYVVFATIACITISVISYEILEKRLATWCRNKLLGLLDRKKSKSNNGNLNAVTSQQN